ncbi:nucleoside 2-deoxyribosyltransferase [Solidesulfovibrio sp. C21]|uniref:nucleoside 2-deoxyribosyltransferase n=1 Tax=Solidesulfovibrio sp. C21 TaxID=3398613 RepID=UPI0039FCBD9C
MRVYLAGPLFSLAERRFMARLRDQVGALPGVVALWPGDFFEGDDLPAMGATAKEHIFRGCLAGVDGCDLVVAVLDGAQVDDGTAFEAGYAHARGLPVWGLRTDFRVAGDTVHSLVNCMIECACARIFRDEASLVDAMAALAVKTEA